ncbi:MAG TPA: DUF5667 domain-containing protein [Candidatus Paceibacterota bacterium]|jgi:hypothetical protein|nr:DUF5667 domain-containing protein [Candidatus Paceibacterota bacterium]
MKDNTIKNTIEDIKKISLTPKEKATLFDVLNWYADSNPSVKSPYSISIWTRHFNRPLSYVLASFLIMLLAGGTTVFASESALPGDVLYPVKIHVSEPIKVALALNAEERQKIQVAQVEERLKEAETLAVQGRLASTTASDLGEAVDVQVRALNTSLSHRNKDQLDITLAAHATVLQSIKDHSSNDQKSHIADIEHAINQSKDKLGNNEDNADSSTTSVKVIIPLNTGKNEFPERKNKVQKVIQETDQKIQANIQIHASNDSFERDILNTASTSIQNAQSNLNQAEDSYSKHNDAAADVLINVSEKKAQEASISIDRGLELGKLKNINRGNDNSDK